MLVASEGAMGVRRDDIGVKFSADFTRGWKEPDPLLYSCPALREVLGWGSIQLGVSSVFVALSTVLALL